MAADVSPPQPDGARPAAEAAGVQPASRDTLPTADAFSRRSTDFGLAEVSPVGPDPLEGRDLGDVAIVRLIAQGGGRWDTAMRRAWFTAISNPATSSSTRKATPR